MCLRIGEIFILEDSDLMCVAVLYVCFRIRGVCSLLCRGTGSEVMYKVRVLNFSTYSNLIFNLVSLYVNNVSK